jgi:hypothetical protein
MNHSHINQSNETAIHFRMSHYRSPSIFLLYVMFIHFSWGVNEVVLKATVYGLIVKVKTWML